MRLFLFSVLTSLTQGNTKSAQQWLDWLFAQYPTHPIRQAAQLLYDEYTHSANLYAACAAVTEYVQKISEINSPVEYMGYANPELTAETLCPFGQ